MGFMKSSPSYPEMDGRSLNKAILEEIQLQQPDKDRYGVAIDEVVRFLQAHDPSFPWSIKRVVKSGSLKRGTAVRGHADVDLVCFIERCPNKGLTNHEKFLEMRQRIINDIADKFGKAHRWRKDWRKGE